MNIGIDIDDTLTDSFDYFMPFVAEYFHVNIHELKVETSLTVTFRKSGKKMNWIFAERTMTGSPPIPHLNRMQLGQFRSCANSAIEL